MIDMLYDMICYDMISHYIKYVRNVLLADIALSLTKQTLSQPINSTGRYLIIYVLWLQFFRIM